MLISMAFAADAATGQENAFTAFLPLLLIFIIFYFLLIRPQQKKLKEHRAMLTALRRGDRIVTNGGIIGLVTKVEDKELIVEIADGVRVHVARDMIASVVSKIEPVTDKSDDKTGDKKDEK